MSKIHKVRLHLDTEMDRLAKDMVSPGHATAMAKVASAMIRSAVAQVQMYRLRGTPKLIKFLKEDS